MNTLEKNIQAWLDMHHGTAEYEVAESVAAAAMERLDEGREALMTALETASGSDGMLVADIYTVIADMGPSIEAWLNRYIEAGGDIVFNQHGPMSFATLVWLAFKVAAYDLSAYLRNRNE